MKLGWITKFALAFGLRKTETFLAAQPDLDAAAHHNAIALAETLGSKTVRTALLAVACDLLKVVDAIRHGTATADDLATHASVLLAAGALMFFRHAIAKRPEVVSRMVDVVKTPLLVALLLSASLAFGQAANSPEGIANSQGSIANGQGTNANGQGTNANGQGTNASSQGPGSNTLAAITSSNIPALQNSSTPLFQNSNPPVSQLTTDHCPLPTSSSPTVSFNSAVAVDLVEMLPGWQRVENFSDFAKAFGTNVSLNAVYSWRSGGGLSSGGAAVAAPLVKVNWQLDPATVWALYGGPSLVLGSDKDGAFSALEAALWTDPLGPLLTWAQKKLPPLAWRPRQVDAFYGYVGAGVETFGADGAGKAVVISAGVGFKF